MKLISHLKPNYIFSVPSGETFKVPFPMASEGSIKPYAQLRLKDATIKYLTRVENVTIETF